MSKNKNEMRPANAEDVDRGTAVFYVPDSRSKVYDLGFPLPVEAVLDADLDVGDGERIPEGTTVRVVQAEIVDDQDVLLGFTYEGGRGVCNLNEVRFG